jgi:hypothetical protein
MSANDDAGLRKPLLIVTWVEFGIAMLLFYARWYSAWRIIHRTAADIYWATYSRNCTCYHLFLRP